LSCLQAEADKVEPLTQQLESNEREKDALNDEFNKLKEKIEEIKHSFKKEISELQDTHSFQYIGP
jgi:predicted  nucleic acid-binding Zn-ribbon protein